jgi:two-component system, NtrC family, sensor histidine kinase AtoS
VLGEFTAIFAHEVRNPINNISTGLQLLASMNEEDAFFQDAINRMQSDCGRLDHLMESVLAFSRPLESTLQPVDMAALLQKILSRWHPRLARVNVKDHFHVAVDTPNVLGGCARWNRSLRI